MNDGIYVEHLSGREKTEKILSLAVLGALNADVRATAVGLMRNAARAPLERIARLQRFVRDSIPYHREPIEMLHFAEVVLRQGGDCDDHTILLGALAWALKYPIMVDPMDRPDNPEHYSLRIGYPESVSPHGDAATTWVRAETTQPAALGQHPHDAPTWAELEK